MDRTLRAALFAAFIAFAVVAGLGIFLGFESGAALITGAVAAGLAAALILAAARRAEGFNDAPPPPVEPGFPGEPEPADDTTNDDGPHAGPDEGPDPRDAR